jgi:hypothetical protein
VRRLLKVAVRVALVLFVALFVYLTVVFVQVWMAARRDDARSADAIIVLGSAQFDGRPSRVLAARLDHAVDLYHRRVAPVVVVTGGKQPVTGSPKQPSARPTCTTTTCPSPRSCARRTVVPRGSRSRRPRDS